MAKTNESTTAVEISESLRSLVLNGLHDKLFDSKRYLSGSDVADEPGPEDLCCDYHRRCYEHNKETFITLKKQKRDLEAAIKVFTDLVICLRSNSRWASRHYGRLGSRDPSPRPEFLALLAGLTAAGPGCSDWRAGPRPTAPERTPAPAAPLRR